jgi:hypothetical protein
MDRSLVDPFGLRDLLGVVRVEHDYQVEVAVADMAWCRFPVRVQRLVRKTPLVSELFRLDSYPLYAFLRRRRYSHDDARDLTQVFCIC